MKHTPSTAESPVPSSASAPVRSMTGFARVTGVTAANTTYVLSLKSVNHRFLDLQFHLPNGMDALEAHWRKVLKEHLIRGHLDVRLSLLRASAGNTSQWNPTVIRSYLEAFRAAAAEHHLPGEPDLNVAFQLPGAWSQESNGLESEYAGLEAAAADSILPAIEALNVMRTQEGLALTQELHLTMDRLQQQVEELSSLRAGMQLAHSERLEQKMRELLNSAAAGTPMVDPTRILQEAAMLAERSDVEEEMTRMRGHIAHFQDLLRQGGELGKKLDFLLQEMSREANTTLSKTGGIATSSLRITELGLAMKSEIEKAREQVQNIE